MTMEGEGGKDVYRGRGQNDGGPQPRHMGSLWKLKRASKQISSSTSRRNIALLNHFRLLISRTGRSNICVASRLFVVIYYCGNWKLIQ